MQMAGGQGTHICMCENPMHLSHTFGENANVYERKEITSQLLKTKIKNVFILRLYKPKIRLIYSNVINNMTGYLWKVQVHSSNNLLPWIASKTVTREMLFYDSPRFSFVHQIIYLDTNFGNKEYTGFYIGYN